MLRLVISSPNLDFPILIPFCQRGNFDIGRILDQVEKVVQSKFQWLLACLFYIDLYTMCKCPGEDWVEHKLSGRGKHKVSGLYAYLKNKKKCCAS